MKKIFIDPGHGGKDPGACGGGLQEKAVVLDIAKKLRDRLESLPDIAVKLSRESNDSYNSNPRKVMMANSWGADLVIAIHCNAVANTGPRGSMTVCAPGSKRGEKLSSLILKAIKENDTLKGLPIIGVRTDSKLGRGANFKLTILRKTDAPATLVETAFISNSKDRELLGKEEGKAAFADAICEAVKEYLEIK